MIIHRKLTIHVSYRNKLYKFNSKNYHHKLNSKVKFKNSIDESTKTCVQLGAFTMHPFNLIYT